MNRWVHASQYIFPESRFDHMSIAAIWLRAWFIRDGAYAGFTALKRHFWSSLIYRLVLVERKILKSQIIITTQEEETYRNIISRYVELYRILKHKNSGVGPCGQIAGSEHINFEGTCGWQRKKSDKGRKCIVLLRKNSYKIIIFYGIRGKEVNS